MEIIVLDKTTNNKIKLNISELPVTQKINTFEDYYNNADVFLEKYTNLSSDKIKSISKDKEVLTIIINKFISINSISSKSFFEQTYYPFLEVLNSLSGIFIIQLMTLNYKPLELLKLSRKELFQIYLLEFTRNQLNFPTEISFETFCKELESCYGKEEKELILKTISPTINNIKYDADKEKIFNEELNKLNEI